MAKGNKRRPDGRIAKQIYLGVGEDGKRKYKTVYGTTNKEAEEKANEFRQKQRRGLPVETIGNTVSTWADGWLLSVQDTVAPKTFATYSSFTGYIKEEIGSMKITDVRPLHIQVLLSKLAKCNPHTGRPSSKKLLLDVRSTARRIFQYAIGSRVLDYNPADYTTPPRSAPKTVRRALTSQEQHWIETTPHRMQTPAMILMYTGVRRGELVPLLRKDFDLENCTLNVNKFVEMVNGHPRLKAYGKTDSAVRQVHFPQRLAEYLRPVFAALPPDALVCPMSEDKMFTDSGWRSAWESYLSFLNFTHGTFSSRPKSRFDPRGIPMVIEPFTAHCLRHTFATMMYYAGVDLLTARDQLGHADIKTTLGIYTHLQDEQREKNMDKMNAFLETPRND